MSTELTTVEERRLVLYNHLTYAMYLISIFSAGLLWVVPIFMNYFFRHQADGSWLASHFSWQIRSFWLSIIQIIAGVGLLVVALGGFGVALLKQTTSLTGASWLMFIAGVLLIALGYLWNIVRIVRGWIALTNKRQMG